METINRAGPTLSLSGQTRSSHVETSLNITPETLTSRGSYPRPSLSKVCNDNDYKTERDTLYLI